ncbi:MAG: L-threonylcarbamoyladenylate synthase [Myxococcota bacterium]|nr:L-threonylcarbamoyladenylate synthase [Myxococcota bacterium]
MPCDAEPSELEHAIAVLAGGGLVAFPTETVWGIAADVLQPSAVEHLRHFKGRDPGQPMSLLIAEPAEAAALGCALDASARALIEAFWPGPITLVLPVPGLSSSGVARRVAGLASPDGLLGIRCSAHPVAAALARAAAAAGIGPLTATSCNRSGAPAAETRPAAREVCAGDQAPLLLETGDDAHGGPASTVVALGAGSPRILRSGAIAEQAIRRVLAHAAGPAGARPAGA